MRAKTASAVALLLLVSGGTPAVAKPPPVLDGKKVTKLSAKAESPTDFVGVEDPVTAAVVSCEEPRCTKIPFIFRPAKGVRAPLSVSHKQFYVGTTDTDLYLLEGKDVVASCTGYLSNARYVQVAFSDMKPGATYTAVMYYSHSAGETVTMEVNFPGVKPRDAQHVDENDPFQSSLTMCGT